MPHPKSHDVLMVVIVGAQGLKGLVRVKCFASIPESLGAYGPLHDAGGNLYTVQSIRSAARDEWVVSFAGMTDRTKAESLKGTKLFVDRGVLPEPTGEEFYQADLIGLMAAGPDGAVIGKVVAIHNFGAGDILQIAGTDGREILMAFTKANVPTIDLALGRMTVVEPETSEAETVEAEKS